MVDPEITLELGDRIAQIAERIGKPDAFSNDNPRLRNLNIIWQFYANYLRETLKRRAGPGYPVWLIEDSFHLDRLLVGPTTLDRTWFEEHTPGGNHVVWPHPHKEVGYQWWILTWTWSRKLLTVSVTHWMVHRDWDMKRNTIYFTRGFTFKEEPTVGTHDLTDSNTNLGKIPRSHRERVMELAKHATQHDDDGWVLTLAPYSLFGTMHNLHGMIRKLDMGNVIEFYLDKEFKAFWLRRVLDALWDGDWRPSRDQIDFDGLLKDTWYIPKNQHFLDKERFERIYIEWDKFRAWYQDKHSIWLGILHGKKLSELVPQNEDT